MAIYIKSIQHPAPFFSYLHDVQQRHYPRERQLVNPNDKNLLYAKDRLSESYTELYQNYHLAKECHKLLAGEIGETICLITQPVSEVSGVLTHVVKMVSTKVHTKARVSEDDLNFLALEGKVLYYLDPKKVDARFHFKYMEFELKNARVVDQLIHLGFHNNRKIESFRGQYEELKKRVLSNEYYSELID
jgi:hypothetical protein